MKLICAIIALAIVTFCVRESTSKTVKGNQSNKAEQEVRRRGAEWLRAIAQRDIGTLDHILAEEVIITDASGKVRNKAQELMLRKAYDHHTSYNNTLEKVHFYGDAAVVTGLYTVRVQAPQRKVYWVEYRYTSMWSKRGKKWQIVAQQFTRIAED